MLQFGAVQEDSLSSLIETNQPMRKSMDEFGLVPDDGFLSMDSLQFENQQLSTSQMVSK